MLIKNLEKLSSQRVLTMSNNRKCNYLCVDVGRNSTTIMGIQNNTYVMETIDVVFIKEIFNKKINKLVEEIRNICYEFDIHIVLTDIHGFGLGFYEEFNKNIPSNFISIRKVNILDYTSILIEFENDVEKSKIRLLQTSKCAKLSYKKSFLGYSDIMNFHRETDELINEIKNLDIVCDNKRIKLQKINEDINDIRFRCLMLYYIHTYNIENCKHIKDYDINEEVYNSIKEINKQKISRQVFYKYMFKAIDNKEIKIIFYHNNYFKLEQFKNIIKEENFKELFNDKIKEIKISKECIEIIFNNNSMIQFVYVSDNARGYRFHYAVVDSDINKEIFNDVVLPKGILFDIDKKKKNLKDNYNIEFVEM